MQDSFDALEYFRYLGSRWKFIGACCAIAVALALVASLLLPTRYTATASILIDAPAGNDPRAATAVSPVYLESLKTYERFAESDTLFQRAIERFQLRTEIAPESLKRSVLRVSKPRDTKLLEISVTLPDPKKAQAVAQFLAQETANLNLLLSRQSDDEFIEDAKRQVERAKTRLEAAEQAWARETGAKPTESLQAELTSLLDLKSRLGRELVGANVDASEYGTREKGAGDADEARIARRDLAMTQARAETLRKEIGLAESQIRATESSLTERRALADKLDAERKAARTSYDAATTHLNEVQATAGIRGERLKIIDPGIVPQRPSSPNVPLNVLIAFFAALIASGLYVTAAFGVQSRSVFHERRAVHR